MNRDELNAMVHQTTNPAQLAGLVCNALITQENIAEILEHFGQHGIIWLMLIRRSDITDEQMLMASRVPDGRVLGALLTHRFATREIKEWILEYATELADTDDPDMKAVFTHVAEYAARVLASEPRR